MNALDFQKSINKELLVLKDRVRNLIGEKSWLDDGKHKESVLKNIIRRFLPNNISVGTGFIIKNDESGLKQSTQIDIIVYNNNYPVLFSDGDFIITTPENVIGIIEVKTDIQNSKFPGIISKANKNGKLINKQIFNGIFSFEYSPDLFEHNRNLNKFIHQSLLESKGAVNHISFGENWFIRYWENENNRMINENCNTNNFYNIYEISELSFSYFISNLIEYVMPELKNDRYWFLYPIEGTKELSRKDTLCIK